MKLFATLFLSAVTTALFLSAVTTASLFAASIPRCDVSGVNKTGNVKLTPGTVEGGMKVIHQTWGDQATRQHRISATAPKAIGSEWTLCKFVFTPETSGNVNLSIGGQWGKTENDRAWMLVSKLAINGQPVTNSDMKKTTNRNGKIMPNGFWLGGKKVKYVADGGPDGAAAVAVNHDNRVYRTIKVEAGKPVTVEYMAKATEAPAD